MYTHTKAKSKYNAQKISLLLWRVEYLADCTMDYQDSWAMRNLICYCGVLIYKLQFKLGIWIRINRIVKSSWQLLLYLMYAIWCKTKVLKLFCLAIKQFIFLLHSFLFCVILLRSHFRFRSVFWGEKKVFMPLDTSNNKSYFCIYLRL